MPYITGTFSLLLDWSFSLSRSDCEISWKLLRENLAPKMLFSGVLGNGDDGRTAFVPPLRAAGKSSSSEDDDDDNVTGVD